MSESFRLSVSVALCTYNGERFLREQLDSFAQQTRLPDELVVCDDGSTDSTLDILREWANTVDFPVTIMENERNLGFAKNFEKAISLCSKDLVFLSDQDDVWHTNKIEKMTSVFQRGSDIGVVSCDSTLIDEKGVSFQFFFHRQVHRTQDYFLAGFVRYKGLRLYSGCCMALRTEKAKQMLPVPDCWYHDFWFNLLAPLYSRSVSLNDALVFYRRHENNITCSEGTTDCCQECIKYYYRSQLYLFDLYEPQITALRKRLESLSDSHMRNRFLKLLKRNELHIEARKQIQNGGKKELFIWIWEVLSGRYFSFPQPFRSICFDAVSLWNRDKREGR